MSSMKNMYMRADIRVDVNQKITVEIAEKRGAAKVKQ